ncbi:MAG TPA: sulfatase-like hydrolase/transferase [Actinomycetota bacterium]|nr:sulfatase-like hydrolase/transferase [Actinomycetota bacterium]
MRTRWLAGFKRWAVKPPVVHPFLFAAFPILFLFARNLEEDVVFSELVPPLALSIGTVSLVMAVGWLIVRDLKVVGLVVAGWTLLFFSYGHLAEWLAGRDLAGIELGSDAFLLTLWGVLALAVVGAVFVFRRRLPRLTQGLNVVAAALVILNLVPIAMYRPPAAAAPPRTAGTQRDGVPNLARTGRLPDIYYIVPDRYGASSMHRRTYGIDTRPFLDFLKSKGFYVASESVANYGSTHQSLASSLNMQYLHTLLGEDTVPRKPLVYRTLHNPAVVRFLKSLGYRYVLSSAYRPMRNDPAADIRVGGGDLAGFAHILYSTTVLPALSRVFNVAEEQLDPRRKHWERTLSQFEQVARTTRSRRPQFVIAHLLVPHEPYVFDRNGNFVSEEEERRKSWRVRYADQVLYTNRKLRELINTLLADKDNPPIIVLQPDEGQWPRRYWDRSDEFNYQTATRTELLDKFQIINAYYLPGVPRKALYPSITPVNSFRLIFNHYFGAGLRLLPDRVYGRELNPVYHFVEITHLLGDRRRA